MTKTRAPYWLLILGLLLTAVSFPVDGLAGFALGLAGIACNAAFLIRHLKSGGA